MTIVKVNFGNNATNSPGAGWNHLYPDETVVAQISADLLDDLGASTGWTLDITNAFSGTSGTTGTATGGAGGWPQQAFDYSFYKSSTATLTLAGLPSGGSFTAYLAGGGNASAPTDYTLNGVTGTYTPSGDPAAPAAPVEVVGTVSPTGEVVIDVDIAAVGGASFGYISAFTLDVAAPSYTITSIDGDNDVQAGQTNVDIVMTATTGVTSVTLGGESLTINGVT